MKTGIIVQERVGSTRLPGKSTRNIQGRTVTEHILDRLKTSRAADTIILAIPDTPENSMLARIAIKNNVDVFCGPEEDILKRYFLAAEKHNLDIVIRVTGDNPFIDAEAIDKMVQQHRGEGNHYTATGSLPLGCGSEVFNRTALERAYRESSSPGAREHVTPYFYRHPDIFKIGKWSGPYTALQCFYRLTLDTEADYLLINALYKALWDGKTPIPVGDVVRYLDENPDMAGINSHIHQKDLHE